MTDPTITCPQCGNEIKLTNSLAAPIVEASKREFERQLAAKDSEVLARENALKQREEALPTGKEGDNKALGQARVAYERVMASTLGMYGDLQGIAGSAVPEIECGVGGD